MGSNLGLLRGLGIALALEIAADQHFTAAGFTGGVDAGAAEQADAITEDFDPSTLMCFALRARAAFEGDIAVVAANADVATAVAIGIQRRTGCDLDIRLRHQADTTVGILHQAGRVDRAAVLEATGKQARRAVFGNDIAEVDNAVVVIRLHIEFNQRIVQAGDAN